MATDLSRIPFPYSSLVMDDVPPGSAVFDQIVQGESEYTDLEYGFAITSNDEEPEHPPRYLLFFQRKPYAAGTITEHNVLQGTTLREFFVYLAQNPRAKMAVFRADPVLIKSVLVLQECPIETQGQSEFIKIENMVVGLMEGRKDALVTLIQDGRFNLAFVKGGKVVKGYSSDKIVQSSGGMDWMDLLKRIEFDRSRGQEVRIRVYERMDTEPAEDYLSGEPDYPGGVFRYYTRSQPELIVKDRTRTLKRVNVASYPFLIGRGQESSLVLNDPGVSRQHAVLEEREGRVYVRDLDSLNGIFVNDHFTREFALQDGDRITIGSHLLQVVLPRSPAEDVSLVSGGAHDATMAMDREARVKVACPQCGAAGTMEASRLYSAKKVLIRCPNCQHRFSPVEKRG